MFNSNILRKLFPKALSREVIEVFAGSPAIKKLGHNDQDDYDYLMILTICQDFKKELFARGIIFTATDVDCLFEQVSEDKDTFTIRCTVRTKFEARRKCWLGMQRFELGESLGAGLDPFDHIALATAQTFAYKAMLKRSSMTYGVKDDPEARRSMTPNESVRVAAFQRRAWGTAVRNSGRTPAAISDELTKIMGFEIDCEQIPDLPHKDFEIAMKWLLSQEDLSAQWSAAVVDIKSRKPQPIVAAMDAAPEEMTGD